MSLPTSPFDASKSIFAGLSVIQLKIGVTTYVFEASNLDDDNEQEIKSVQRPDSSGTLRKARTVQTKANEKWTFGLDEVKRLLDIFGGHLRGRKSATCTLWIPDPDDASGKVALKSEDDFPVTVSREGKLSFGNSDFSKVSILIESNKIGDVTWTADATA